MQFILRPSFIIIWLDHDVTGMSVADRQEPYHWRRCHKSLFCRDKIRLPRTKVRLSRQNFCRNKIMFANDTCLDRLVIILWTNLPLPWGYSFQLIWLMYVMIRIIVTTGDGMRCGQVGRVSDWKDRSSADVSWTPRWGEAFFSQSQLSTQTLCSICAAPKSSCMHWC